MKGASMAHQRPTFADRAREVRAAKFPIEGIVKERHSATRYGVLAIVCFEILWYALYRTYHNFQAQSYVWAAVTAVGSALLAYSMYDYVAQARVEFLKAYRKFYLRRYVPALDALEDEGYNPA